VRVVLFTGKGGVGKTTLAAATAVHLAAAGRPALAVSTDPAHSLGDALEADLDGEPREVAPGLWGAHIDTRALLDRSWTGLQGHLRTLLAGRPVGLLQRARIRDYPEDLTELVELVDVPEDAYGLDYLIGEPALRGRGLGSRFLARAVERTWQDHPGAGCVLVPVSAANTASWRALEKAGLRRVATGELTPDNPVDDRLHHVYRVDRP